MRFRAVLGVVVAVAAVVAVTAPGLAVAGSAAGQAQPTATSTTSNTTIAIQPRPNGDARVRVETRFVLHDANDSAAFRRLGRGFEAGRAGVSVSTFEWAANGSSIATGRGMNVTNVTRNATVVGENATTVDTGRLTLGFTWTNFARTDGDRLVVGDAFNGTRGTWLPALTTDQTLLIESPSGYTISRSPVGITNGTARFDGPATFAPGTPVVWFERRGDSSTTRGPTTPTQGLFGSIPTTAIGAGVLVVVGAVVAGAYVLMRRDGNEPTDGRAEASPPAETDEPSAVDDSPDETAEELLSDEERVERLLTRNGGRMKQASIVDETGWSNAKVSQLLSAMDEADRVDKLRIGRENLISLPGDD